MLGISELQHPLLQERIIQTLDGDTRLYAMPFAALPAQAAPPAVGATADDAVAAPTASREAAGEVAMMREGAMQPPREVRGECGGGGGGGSGDTGGAIEAVGAFRAHRPF